MNETQFTIAYPEWYILLCLLCGLVFATLLYYSSGNDQRWNAKIKVILFLLRSLSISIICFLLLTPVLRHNVYTSKKPTVYIGVDQSESVGFALSDNANVLSQLQQLKDKLKAKFDVQDYHIGLETGTGLSPDFNDKGTNLNSFFEMINQQQQAGNNGAVILFSDGIFNQGPSPLFEASRVNKPVFTIAVGDTLPARDLSILNIDHNEIGYLGDITTFQADIQAFNLSDQQIQVRLSRVDGNTTHLVQSQTLQIRGNSFFQTVTFQAKLGPVGNQKYLVEVTKLQGETTHENNQKVFYIEVLDSKLNIDLIAAGPHPDIAAIKEAISQDKNYDLKINFLSNPVKLHDKPDLVICYQVPSNNQFAATFTPIWNSIRSRSIPVLFMVGAQTDLAVFNQLQSSLKINGYNANSSDAYPISSPRFTYFNIPSEWRQMWLDYPPLQVPFGQYSVAQGNEILMYQRIGKVETNFPLWILGNLQNHKMGFINGEGLWRWRMYEARSGKDKTLFDDLFRSTVRYLVARDDKRKFRVRSDENLYSETDAVHITAELYNKNYEAIVTPEVRIKVQDSKGKSYSFIPTRTSSNYVLDAGVFPPGEYNYTGTTSYEGQNLSASGKFTVAPLQRELFDLVADFGLMHQLADQSAGKMFMVNELNSVADELLQSESIKPVIQKDFKADPFINFKWIFAILILLLGLEWLIRRLAGRY